MLIPKLCRSIIYDMMLIVCLIIAGYTIALKMYIFAFMFIVIAFLFHSRLTKMLELIEEDVFSETREV